MRYPRAGILLIASLGVLGCAKSVPLERGVLAYDRASEAIRSKELLLNIARARHNLPLHFTAISNIAATYKVSFAAGLSPALTGDSGFLVVPFASGGAEENPTISITPLQGEEFTRRLLTPLPESRVTMLLQQGYDVDALLRLIGAELRLARPGAGRAVDVFRNRPSDREGYEGYRRAIAHLSWIQDRHGLRVEPLVLHYEWTIPSAALTPDVFQSLSQDFALTHDATSDSYRVVRQLAGRAIVANYDPATLSLEERASLNAQALAGDANEILLDIRPDHAGGRFPMHGWLRLRSFHEVLSFIGRAMEEEPEYDVKPDPRTPAISENPVETLGVLEAREPHRGVRISVELEGRHYALKPDSGYAWNRKVFNLLYQLYQMTVQEPASAGPSIAIAK